MTSALRRANDAVRSRRKSEPGLATMAATVTIAGRIAGAAPGSDWVVVNLGDSPAWQATDGDLVRLTDEHNEAAELVRAGVITPDQARSHPGRHVITRAIGLTQTVRAATAHVSLRPGDDLVLASDGLEVLGPADVHRDLRGHGSAQAAAQRLVDHALARGATDNVTVAVLRHLRSFRDGDVAG